MRISDLSSDVCSSDLRSIGADLLMLEWGGVIRRRVGGRTPLAIMFFLCSFWPMEQIDTSRVADTILAAPGWARLGITAPASHEIGRASCRERVCQYV